MPFIASWRDKTWEVSANRIYSLQGFSTGYELNIEKNSSTNADIIKGLKPQSITLETPVITALNVNIMAELNGWKKRVGKTGNLKLGKSSIVFPRMMLVSVNLSDTTINDHGNLVKAKIAFKFEEKQTDLQAATDTSAVDVTAPKEDKTDKKSSNPAIKK